MFIISTPVGLSACCFPFESLPFGTQLVLRNLAVMTRQIFGMYTEHLSGGGLLTSECHLRAAREWLEIAWDSEPLLVMSRQSDQDVTRMKRSHAEAQRSHHSPDVTFP